jgi:ectoine hydroxylase-related dioxygenase (phytanoyl-CoA dioxygenase family)
MLTQSQIQEFHKRGYLKAGKVLTDAEVEALRERLDLALEERAESKPELLRNLAGGDLYARRSEEDDHMPTGLKIFASNVVIQIVNIWEADRLFNAHMYNPKITAMVAQLCNTDTLRVWHDQIQYKPPRVGAATGWHQDYPAWPILDPADLVSAWVALDDATMENGCMRMVPGSHKWGVHRGRIKTGENFTLAYDPEQIPAGEKVEVEPVEVMAGEVAFHHCLTWHGSPKNPSEKKRRAIAVHYMPGHTRFVPRGGHVMSHRVEVKEGEILQGKYFPTVWDKGPLPPAPLPGLA